jgi:hypothetical protein
VLKEAHEQYEGMKGGNNYRESGINETVILKWFLRDARWYRVDSSGSE